MIKRSANVNVKSQKAVRRLLVVAAIVLVGGGVACWGAAIGFRALRSIWLEQFRVQDSAIDVIVTTPGVNVIPEIITFHFGLTNGANLATIPYQEKSRELIARNPNIRSISIERRLPRRVIIDAGPGPFHRGGRLRRGEDPDPAFFRYHRYSAERFQDQGG